MPASARHLLGSLLLLAFQSCDPGGELPADAGGRSPAEESSEVFVDRALEVGLEFRHQNGMTGRFYIVEPLGPGVALFDLEGDGDLDAYVTQGGPLGPEAAPPPAKSGDLALCDRLFRNLLVESGTLRFEDVTAASLLRDRDYGMGVAAGDMDGDGDVDLYVTNFGENHLYRNDGGGVFRDVTAASGTAESRWSTSASFFDQDRDGDLDLYVCNYVDFSYATHKTCYSATGAPDYCGPLAYEPFVDRLFRNRGDGTFEDVTASSQIFRAYGAALGVVACDLNGDDWIDVYVANDAMPNQLWINQGDGRFADEAVLNGCAVNQFGIPEGSMGVDAGDYDDDGDLDLFMTHIVGETNTLYRALGGGLFEDATGMSGLGPPSLAHTGFGTAWFDYDSDGLLDLFVANGAVKAIEALQRAGDPFPLHEPNQLYHNEGGGRLRETTDSAGAVFGLSEVSRGVAVGDVDNDGDADLLVSNNDGPLRLLINGSSAGNSWLGLRLVGGPGKRDQYGAVALFEWGDGRSVLRHVRADGSYLSASDPRILLGLGIAGAPDHVKIRWPDGTRESFALGASAVGRYRTLAAGTGQAVE